MITIPIEVFLSHADEDKITARRIADALEKYQVKTFVAHDDIDAGDDWETTLINKIRECDLFIALLSENFHNANYTDHEVGIARGLNRPIIPIRIDNTSPYGFMSKFQAKKMSADVIGEEEIADLVHSMSTVTEKGRNIIDNLIREFANAGSYDKANEISITLFTYTKFSKEQINAIVAAYVNNGQIRGGWSSDPRCITLFKDNWKKIDEPKKAMLRSLWE
ncbi:MAG: toll/interleukin-1 receptor domain-containing protein [Thaumarchaeota archaeon]|nr:toll/interleukin-1 receptor domain-containing protein [Nitrososphaerota archaeon]